MFQEMMYEKGWWIGWIISLGVYVVLVVAAVISLMANRRRGKPPSERIQGPRVFS